jgi:hypothetical protein
MLPAHQLQGELAILVPRYTHSFACIFCRKCLGQTPRKPILAMVRRSSAVQGDVAMMNVKLPGGREVRAPWSNLAPCGMISERLAEILQLQQLPLKSSRKDMCMTVFGGFGGSKEQWCYVKELDVSLTVQRVGSSNLEELKVTVGPLVVNPRSFCPLVFGADIERAVNGSIMIGQTAFVFEALGVRAPLVLSRFTGPDPDNPGAPFDGTCSWWWNPEVEHETCAQCGLKFPNLMKCAGCHQLTYCSRSCQKRHWKQHKSRCLQKRE